uniref:ATP synthase subunit alpha, chloroplastic n=1 Tax=Chromera velia TaxID=505693 RepID=D9IXG5_9ALVE|nr:ATP synthase CF1 alpha subunit [Chromera velia]ADJ66573.1 ATP synthase CF1 alpha subunit [Chromera velia]
MSSNTSLCKASDGVILSKTLPELQLGELVLFDTGYKGIALTLSQKETCILLLGKPLALISLTNGTSIWPTEHLLKVPVGKRLLGCVVDPLGTILKLPSANTKKSKKKLPYRRIETASPGIIMRQSVDTPVLTGILVVDNLVPIGRGQRELIIGDRQTGKTSIAIDTILNQNCVDGIEYCIYVNIGQRSVTVGEIRKVLEEGGALKYTVLINAASDAGAALQYIAPFVGTTQAEYFLYSGHDCLIIYDDLSKHAQAYRELSLILRRPPGREAYPGDIFYLHSRLLERASKLTSFLGGGSLTALPVIETQGNDVSAYIPTNVISITDGQIYLSQELFNSGIRPALNVGLSVSRVGSAAQPKPIKKLVGPLKITLAQFIELKSFAQFSTELDDATAMILQNGERLQIALTQRQGRPYHLVQSFIRTYVTVNSFLNNIEPAAVLRILDLVVYTYLWFIYSQWSEWIVDSSGNTKMESYFNSLRRNLRRSVGREKKLLLMIGSLNQKAYLKSFAQALGIQFLEAKVGPSNQMELLIGEIFPEIATFLEEEAQKRRAEEEALEKQSQKQNN